MAITIRASQGIVGYIDATSGVSSHTINLSDAAVGDVRIISVIAGGEGNGSILPTTYSITGWTPIHTPSQTTSPSGQHISSFYRVVQSGDTLTSATLGITWSSTTCGIFSIAYTLEGVDTTNVLDTTAVLATPATGTPPAPAITTVTDGAFIGYHLVHDSNNGGLTDTTIPSGSTVIYTHLPRPPENGAGQGCAYLMKATAGLQAASTWAGVSEDYASITFAIRPATAPAGTIAVGSGSMTAAGSAPTAAQSDNRIASPAKVTLQSQSFAPTFGIAAGYPNLTSWQPPGAKYNGQIGTYLIGTNLGP